MTIRVHRNEDPAFDEACEDAELDAHAEIEDALFKAATTGNITACIFYLKNRCPERWKDVNRFEGAVQQDTHTVHHLANEKIDEHRAGVLRSIMGIPEDVCLGQPVGASLVAVEAPKENE